MREYIRKTAQETRYMMRNPEEIKITLDRQRQFLQMRRDELGGTILLAFLDGIHIGSCSLASMGEFQRYAHRCTVAIGLYQEYCGRGIGKILLSEILELAESIGYEQVELEVVTTNERAVRLYQSLGFQIYGTLPNNMKYPDGTYADCYWMMKRFL